MSKFKVGDIALRAGAGKSRWKWRVIAVKGVFVQKVLLEAINDIQAKRVDNLLLEEYARSLYKYEAEEESLTPKEPLQ